MASSVDPAFPNAIAQLVSRYRENRDQYRGAGYNETQLRREFVDPFFAALGWDVANTQGHAEAYKDVIHEDSIQIEGSAKAPDYGFRIGGTRKFFVETKKPAVNIGLQAEPAFQLRRYAWSAKLPLSILTDFEEFAVYDTRIRPEKSDSASKARILYITFEEYETRWSEIQDVFGREAILKGAFDKYAESKKKRGTTEVDDAFLETIREWREALAKDIHKNNDLSERQLNHSVQSIIDRVIFLRICEDRGTEDFGRLQKITASRGLYASLVSMFREADRRYNSGLFHFDVERGRPSEPDTTTPSLAVSDSVLKRVAEDLYYPSPYDFRVFPPDVLGQVYERFLGDVITVSKTGKSVKIVPKPEVRKAGGVFYTPTYIVDYIVRQTLGVLIEGKRPYDVAGRTEKTFKHAQTAHPIRVLDPACGSGSFLLGAYQHLLDWYRDQYAAAPTRWMTGASPTIYQAGTNDFRLTIAERKRILLDHVYGVDIDRQAVEVTKLSLLLKCLEGESSATIGSHLFHMKERALPDLDANIKCGNSLIASNYYSENTRRDLSAESRVLINAFDWRHEYPDVFVDGGFDVVISNPPYVLLQDEFRDDEQLEYFRSHYATASYKIDTYHLFLERATSLLSPNGRGSLITPSNYWTNNGLAALRLHLIDAVTLESLTNLGPGVFPRISVDTAVCVLANSGPTKKAVSTVMAERIPGGIQTRALGTIDPQSIRERPGHLFTGSSASHLSDLTSRLLAVGIPLGDVAHVNFGKQLRDRKTFPRDVIKVSGTERVPQTHSPCWTGQDAKRYSVKWSMNACLKSRAAQSGGCWNDERHEAPCKLLTSQIGRHPVFAADESRWHCLNTMFMISPKTSDVNMYFVLAILNSKVLSFIWRDRFYDQRLTFPKIKGTYLKLLPLPKDCEPVFVGALASNAARITSLMRDRESSTDQDRRRVLLQQICALDQEIDELVFEIYGLSTPERELVLQAMATETVEVTL